MTPRRTKNELPLLYSPAVTVFLSLLFSPVMGGLLQAWNWQALGDEAQRRRNLAWVRWCFVLYFVFAVIKPVVDGIPSLRYFLVTLLIVTWAAWTVTTGFAQVVHVKDVMGNLYAPRLFGRAILCGSLGWMFFWLISFTAGLACETFGWVVPGAA